MTPSSADPTAAPAFAVDTSVAVAFLIGDHSAHERCVDALDGVPAALAGHATFETFAVLTRLPGAGRVDPGDAGLAIRSAFPARCWLEPAQQTALFDLAAEHGIVGGMVYDALVGEAARVNDLTLLTRDRRAVSTYEFLGVAHRVI